MTEAIKSLFEMLVQKEKSGSDYTGRVTRVEGSTAYVQFDGSMITDTPVSLSIGAKSGDTVRVRVADGRAWLIGNDTAPPNDSSEVASGLVATNSQLASLGVSYTAFNTVVTNELVAHQAVIDQLDATYANITFANIDTANIDKASIRDLFVQVGLIRDAVIDGARITGYLDAVSVNAANITAGTLATDRLVIRGTTGSIVYALNNITGALQSQSVDTLNGEILTERTINADKIVAHSVTATEITTQNLVGTNGWINLSSGTFCFGANNVDALSWDGSTLAVNGVLTAGAGSAIGPWTVSNTSIYKGNASWGNATAGAAYFGNDGISITDKFKVSANGAATMTSGTVGGWSLNSTLIYKSGILNGIEYRPFIQAPTTITTTGSAAFAVSTRTNNGAGTTGSWSYPFLVTYAGKLYSTDADIRGKITATEGTIAGFTISGNKLQRDGFISLESDNGSGYGRLTIGNASTGPYVSIGNNEIVIYGTGGLGGATISPTSVIADNIGGTDIYGTTIYENTVSLANKYYPKAGGASVNNYFQVTHSANSYVQVRNTTTGSYLNLYTAAGGSQGLYSPNYWTGTNLVSAPLWLIHRDTDGYVQVPNVMGNTSYPVVSYGTDGSRVSGLRANGATTFGARGQWGVANGDYTWKNITTSASDIRLKENIEPSDEKGLDLINRIRLYKFDWKDDHKHQKIGFIADYLEEIDANMTVGGGYGEDGSMDIKSVDAFYLQAYEVKAIQELSAKVEELERRLA